MTGNDLVHEHDAEGSIVVTAENVGGITDAELTLHPGVTLLTGRNASNKSSLLRALAGVLGGPVPPIRSDADRGSVRMGLPDEGYELALERRGDTTAVRGADVYSEAGDLCELFVALTETNPIRRAVLADGDLHDLLLRPVDTDAIRAEIRRLRAERESVDDRLAELDAMEDRLPALVRRRDDRQERLSTVESRLRERRETVARLEEEGDGGDGDGRREELRAERDDLRRRVETGAEALGSLETELREVTDRLGELRAETTDATLSELTDELERLHEEKRTLTDAINRLGTIVETNAELLEGEVPAALRDDDVVAQLDPSSRTVTCWTCGSGVERTEIEEQLDALREVVREKRDRRNEVSERIETLTGRRERIEERRAEIERLSDRREAVAEELDRRRETLADDRDRLRTVEAELEELGTVSTDTEHEAELRDCYEAISELEYERGQVATDLESLEEKIDSVESELERRDEVEARREEVATRLCEQRGRIDEIERDLVATFNDVTARVLEALDYDAVERVWIERRSRGDGPDADTEFELHVVREGEAGMYEDTVDTLSKSEREVIGLVVALSGYLVHDVGSEVPFLVVDAVEMFDADRIERLLALLAEHADYVVAAVLPEEAAEIDAGFETVRTSSFADD